MPDITIQISPLLQRFLNRYYPMEKPIDLRFYEALNEGHIVAVGKSFALTIEMKEKLEMDTELDQRYSDNNL